MYGSTKSSRSIFSRVESIRSTRSISRSTGTRNQVKSYNEQKPVLAYAVSVIIDCFGEFSKLLVVTAVAVVN